jgi:hypothetical protein
MAIGRLSYVICDECGDPAQPADDSKEARQQARIEGYATSTPRKTDTDHLIRRDYGRADYCWRHRPDRPIHCEEPASFMAGGYWFCKTCGSHRTRTGEWKSPTNGFTPKKKDLT